MSYFKVSCPGCEKSLKVPENLAGKSRACPYCRATVRIPESQPAEPSVSFPNIQVDDGTPKSKKSVQLSKKPDKSSPPSQPARSPKVSTKQPVTRKRRQKSWFSSNSDSASSDVSLLLSGLMGAGMTVVW